MSTGNSSRGLLLVACRLELVAWRLARRFSLRSIQNELTVPRTCWSGAVAMLRVKNGLHHFDVGISSFDHEHSITCNIAVVTPVRGQLVLYL